MNKNLVFFVLFFISCFSHAELQYHESRNGDHYVYIPKIAAKNILVIAHGMYKESESPRYVAKRFIGRWHSYADKYGLLLIAPVFDDERFGALSQGYGGYRNLFGKHIPADKFVNGLVDKYARYTSSKSHKFYLYGHSAGGQFTNRYVVTHPQRILRATISAAGRFSYPSKDIKWPYGAGDLSKKIKWDNGAIVNRERVTKSLFNYALAAAKIAIVIGSRDTKPQPSRRGHIGTTRIDYSQSWAKAMNKNARMYGKEGKVSVNIVNGIGHDSKKLTRYCADILFSDID